jgi:hypothetical protein
LSTCLLLSRQRMGYKSGQQHVAPAFFPIDNLSYSDPLVNVGEIIV